MALRNLTNHGRGSRSLLDHKPPTLHLPPSQRPNGPMSSRIPASDGSPLPRPPHISPMVDVLSPHSPLAGLSASPMLPPSAGMGAAEAPMRGIPASRSWMATDTGRRSGTGIPHSMTYSFADKGFRLPLPARSPAGSSPGPSDAIPCTPQMWALPVAWGDGAGGRCPGAPVKDPLAHLQPREGEGSPLLGSHGSFFPHSISFNSAPGASPLLPVRSFHDTFMPEITPITSPMSDRTFERPGPRRYAATAWEPEDGRP